MELLFANQVVVSDLDILKEWRITRMKCVICNTEIRGPYVLDAWNQAMCAAHKVEFCSSCGRFVKSTDLHLADGRCLCSLCRPSVVSAQPHIEWVEKRVRPVLAKYGIDGLPVNIPIKIVTPAEMAGVRGGGQITLEQHGLTKTIMAMGVCSKQYRHTIYILDSTPKIRFAGVLAHEMLHVWLNEKGASLSPMHTEGFCNMGSYVVYKEIDNELSLHMIKQMEKDPNPVYGDGFRCVKRYFDGNSWPGLYDAIKRL